MGASSAASDPMARWGWVAPGPSCSQQAGFPSSCTRTRTHPPWTRAAGGARCGCTGSARPHSSYPGAAAAPAGAACRRRTPRAPASAQTGAPGLLLPAPPPAPLPVGMPEGEGRHVAWREKHLRSTDHSEDHSDSFTAPTPTLLPLLPTPRLATAPPRSSSTCWAPGPRPGAGPGLRQPWWLGSAIDQCDHCCLQLQSAVAPRNASRVSCAQLGAL